jgi:hypothetical protein
LNSYVEFIPDENVEAAEEACGLLPDDSWIAIVCGVTKEQWNAVDGDVDEGLPDGFYVAPKDVYMPDLTAVADVLLGKLVGVFWPLLPYENVYLTFFFFDVGIWDSRRMCGLCDPIRIW